MRNNSGTELTTNSNEGLVLIDKDRKILFADIEALSLLGLQSNEVIGQNCSQLTSVFPCSNSACADPANCCRMHSCKTDAHFSGRDLDFRTHVVKSQSGRYLGVLHLVSAVNSSSINRLNLDDASINTIEGFIGNHPSILRLMKRVVLLAKTDVTAHIYAESGCGKELIAAALHKMSPRHDAPFVKINCSAIPTTLLESALFGHTKGAFTGASHDSKGFVEAAQHGTLFLDEIGDLPLSVQVKLLRLIQNREFSRVGESSLKKADIRIITATNQKLADLVKEHKIREDFYYRINVFPLNIPALRERLSDIPALINYFIKLFNKRFNKNIEGFTAQAMSLFMTYNWPGNVRELENTLEYAFVLLDDGLIDIEDLPEELTATLIKQPSVLLTDDNLSGVSNLVNQSQSPDLLCNKKNTQSSTEEELILQALEKVHGNRAAAAALLGFSRVTLWKKMKNYSLLPKNE